MLSKEAAVHGKKTYLTIMKKIISFLRQFETDLAAIAFAEAGEHETAHEIIIGSKSSNKKIIVGTHDMALSSGLLPYAVGLRRRMEAGGIEVMHIIHPETPAFSAEINSRLGGKLRESGIHYQFFIEQNGFAQTLLHHTTHRRDLLCLVIDAEAVAACLGSVTAAKRKLNRALKHVSFPVVMYWDGVTA